jgi:dTMP kinase
LVLVIIDGLDASGKSTQALVLCRYLKGRGRTVCLRIHPSDDNLFGVSAKRFLYLQGKGAHFAAALFYMLDVVRSIMLYSWRKHDYIVFVRYLMGTAYLPSPLHIISYHFFISFVPTSSFMFFLDVSPAEAVRRLRMARQRLERFESLEELKRTRRKALSLASTGKWTIINAAEPQESVARELRKALCLSF